jgi:hypothetical protein
MDGSRFDQSVASMDAGAGEPGATWVGSVLIPLVQNVVGGIAVFGLGVIGVRAFTGEFATDPILWCAFVGGALACLMTVTRFFGDDLGLFTVAYNAGRRSRDHDLDILNKKLHGAQAALDAAGQPSSGTVISQRVHIGQIAMRNARTIAQVAYAGSNYSRRAMKDKMGEKDHSRAMRVLCVGNVLDRSTLTLRRDVCPNVNDALKMIDRIEKEDIPMLSNRAYVPGWW